MNNKYNILFVDDEKNILKSLKRLFFMDKNLKVYTAESAENAERVLNSNVIDIVVTDEKMPDTKGHEFISFIYKYYPDTVRIILTGHADVESLLSAVNEGEVYRYLLKPWNDIDLKMTISKAIEYLELKRENSRMKEQIKNYKEKLNIK